jgi:glycosyltransferase involved in cell wall biosynthesis
VSPSPVVSIVVPVFNGERYLRESLDSILVQTYPRIEVLVMDDASNDGTAVVLADYGDRVRYVRQPETRGIYGNINDGIARVDGDYIAVYHADDVYEPDIVEREVTFLERYREAGAVFCQDIFIDAGGREYGRLSLPPEVRGGHPLEYRVVLNALLTYKNRFLRSPTSMVRASVYEDVGGYRDAEFCNTSDLEMWLRIARKYPIGILERYLVRYRHGTDTSSRRYHHLRTDPERHFVIVDLYLGEGDRAMATPEALAAHEAHRAEDRLMRAISHYILGDRSAARRLLACVRMAQIWGSPRVQRGRLLALLLLLRTLARVPRIGLAAKLFYRRWHARGRSGKARAAVPPAAFVRSWRPEGKR